jgi:hypothetical protein
VKGQNTTDDVLIDFQTEDLGQVLRKLGTAKTGIAPLKFTDGLDQFRSRSFGPWFTFGVRGVKEPVFEVSEPAMKAEQGGRFENNGSAKKSTRVEEPAGEPKEHPVSRSQIRCPMPGPL